MTRMIRNVVAATTGSIVSYPRTDPPAFKMDRPMKRRVRIFPAAAATAVTINDVSLEEARYYNKTSARWTGLKILCITAYGQLSNDGTNQLLGITKVTDASVGNTSYQDQGDKNHRPCIKIIEPPTMGVHLYSAATNIIEFTAGSVHCVDFYVEFS